MKILSGLREPDGPYRTPIYHSLDPIERTSVQINQLRAVLEITSGLVVDSERVGETHTVHPDVKAAAVKAATSALMQLDNILDDQPRWVATGSESEKASMKFLTAEIARVESETLRNRTAVRPFFTLRAQIYKLPSGQFLAINPTNSLYAQGDTAEQAANNFDGAFYKLQHSPPPEPSLPEPEPKPQPKRRAKAKKTTKK